MVFFGFNGIHLKVPESYNLVKALGDAKSGEIILGPHEQGELVVQYQTIDNPDINKLEQSYFESNKTRTLETKEKLDVSRHYYVYREADIPTTAVLIPRDNQGRTVRLSWLRRKSMPKDDIMTMTAPLLDSTQGHRWAIYYVDMTLPSTWLLRDSALNAGCYYLQLRKKRHDIRVWALTLFNQMLGQQEVHDWVGSFLEARFPKRYRWTIEPNGNHQWRIQGKMRLRWWMNMAQALKTNRRVKGLITLKPNDNQAYLIIHDGKPSTQVDAPIVCKGESCLIS